MSAYDDIELQRAKGLVCDLLETHWKGIMQTVAASDDGQGAVSLGLKLDHDGSNRLVKAKLSYSVKTSDEAEYIVRNPAQKEMPL